MVHLRQLGARLYLVEALQLQGRLLLSQDRSEDAHAALVEARETAEAIGSRRLLWFILDSLADLEESRGDVATSQVLRRRARDEVQALAQNLGDPERSSAFLSSPRVEAVIAKGHP
jgi:hypothetical protein